MSNPVERRRWNDAYWSAVWPKREQLTGAVMELLFRHASLETGQRVLDIGSGAGITTLAASRIVGPSGWVTGADISEPLVDFATARARREALPNVDFVAADVQEDRVAKEPFDAAISQFGVMFFDHPARAFENIRSQLRPGSRLTFACWRALLENPWHVSFALGRFLPAPLPPARGASPTGPFSLAEPQRTTALLADAGWTEIHREPYDVDVTVDLQAIIDDDQLAFLGVPVDQLVEAAAAVKAHLDVFKGGDGRYIAPLAVQTFTALA